MAFWLIQWAKSASERNAYGVPVRNLGKVTEAVWRGALPRREGYEGLARVLGVRRVFSLTDRVAKGEKQRALDAGMRDWQHIPFSDREPPEPALVLDWLNYMRTATAQDPVYTHCMGGRHRTGVLIGVLRVTDGGWTKEQALKEMMHYGYYDALGHGSLRRWFLHDFDPKDYAARDSPAPGSELTEILKGF